MPKDIHQLPLLRDSLSFLYVEHAIVEQDDLSIKSFVQMDRSQFRLQQQQCLCLTQA